MKNESLIEALKVVTNSGYLDVEFLMDRIEEHRLDLGNIIENVGINFGKEFILDINYLIYEALSQIANNFIERNPKLFQIESDEFEIFSNYLDSRIWFNSKKVQFEFERFY